MADNIRDWLTTLELEHWGDVFEANHVALRDVALLTDDDLQDLGLPLGPRRRIVNAAAMLAGNLGVEPRTTIGSTELSPPAPRPRLPFRRPPK